MSELKQFKLIIKELKLPELAFEAIGSPTRQQISIWIVRSLLFNHNQKTSLKMIEEDIEIVNLKELVLFNLDHLGYGKNLTEDNDFHIALVLHIEELLHYTDCLLEQSFGSREYDEIEPNSVLTDDKYSLVERWFWICSATKSVADSTGVLSCQVGLSTTDKNKLVEAFREPTMMERMKEFVKPKRSTFSPKNW